MNAALVARFYALVNENGPLPERRPELGPCHLFGNSSGYAQLEGRSAHRIALELAGVEIPAGYHVDHLCRRHSCVRPSHLEPVTPQENFLRGDHPSAVAMRAGRCRNGHARTAENTYVNPTTGERQCQECVALQSPPPPAEEWELKIKENITQLRTARGWSGATLAGLAGITQSTWSRRMKHPGGFTGGELSEIAALLGVELREVVS
jgi:hypothetical protein